MFNLRPYIYNDGFSLHTNVKQEYLSLLSFICLIRVYSVPPSLSKP